LRLSVDSTGVVRAVEIVPPTKDGKFNDALEKTALGWRFRPALDQGRPVASLFEVKLTF
jgi:TonB family protein